MAKGRQFVESEALSWHICETSLDYWQASGVPLMKAHRIREAQDKYGKKYLQPLCGAGVPIFRDVLAPVGWPKCKHCEKSAKGYTVPKAFYE